jgi:tRNA pseudouridine65 synthase
VEIPILYQDENFIAVNKPSGYVVHPSAWVGRDELPSVMQLLRNAIGQKVYPAHRLDRQTSGVLWFSTNPDADKAIKSLFENRAVSKCYHGIVRGFTEDSFTIDKPLKKELIGNEQKAITHFKCLAKVELPIAIGRYPSSRFSFLQIDAETGRMHQIRRHLSHYRHPLLGDKKYGDNKYNAFIRDQFGVDHLVLHCYSTKFAHPFTQKAVEVSVNFPDDLAGMCKGIFENIAIDFTS